MSTSLLETAHGRYSVEDGIVHAIFTPGLVISLNIAREMVEHRHQLCKGASMPVLMDIREIRSIDTASRKYFTSPRALESISAGAIVTESLISKLIGNIFVRVDNPKIPTRLFTVKDKAIAWLQQYKIAK